MIPTADLLIYSEAEKNAVLKYFNVSSKRFDDMAEQIMEWAIKSSLPVEYININIIKFGLIGCKMSMEKTKEAVISYFRVHTEYPYIFTRLVPNTEEYRKCKLLCNTSVMPKLTPDLCRITICKPNDPLGEATDGATYTVISLMEAEVRIRSADFHVSNYLIIDLQHYYNLALFSKYTPTIIYQLIDIFMSTKTRIKNIHLLNVPSQLDTLMNIVKPFIPNKLFSRVRIHENLDSLYKCIPEDCLPSDLGGRQPSLEEIQEKWCKEFEKHEDEFKRLLSCKWHNMNGRSGQDMEKFGPQGSFRKMSID